MGSPRNRRSPGWRVAHAAACDEIGCCGVYWVLPVESQEAAVADDQGFEAFYQAVFPRLVGQLGLVTGDLTEAEDLVQEALARASARWSRLRDYDVPEAWVRRVALNLAADRTRRLRRKLAALARIGPPPLVPPISEDALVVAAALRTLPLAHRQVLVLHYLADLPVDQIAAQLGIRGSTVRGRLARARRVLATQLNDHAEEVRITDG
jgi:RNA polymerase sigma-70 factor, ECF subfamily